MKTEQLIVQYLFANKSLRLREIGNFTMTEGDAGPAVGEAPQLSSVIEFEYDKNAGDDDGLVAYIMQNTGKIKPLAAADLESYIVLMRQFLHIGKSIIIEGLGTLQKQQTGELGFVQGAGVAFAENTAPVVITEKKPSQISFAKPAPSRKRVSPLLIILLLILLGGSGFAAYKFFSPKKNNIANTAPPPDTLQRQNPVIDSSLKPAPVAKDSNNFYVVIKTYNSYANAQEKLKKLQSYGHKLSLYTLDSSNVKLRMPFVSPLSDTQRVKDSLAKFFGAKTSIDLPQ